MKTPRYEYSRSKIAERIDELSQLKLAYGLKVRYAVKANPHPEIISLMSKGGIYFDASSSYEAAELLELGVPGEKISLSSQQSPHNLERLLQEKVKFVATSLHQLKIYSENSNRPHTVGVRINPNMGHGHNKRTSTGGVAAGFGIWHEYIPQIQQFASEQKIVIDKLHLHIGSGADPRVWGEVMDRTLEIVSLFPDATSLDIGGGYKVHRYGEELETNMHDVMAVFDEKLQKFKAKTGRALQLEIEPGTYFIAHAGTLVAYVDDIVDTGENGYTFIRLNTGMNDFLRTTMYGAQHEIAVINNASSKKEYIVIGHNCESGDILTTESGNSEEIKPRLLNDAQIGDEVRIYDTGAYCASMRARGYNSFPNAEEVFVD